MAFPLQAEEFTPEIMTSLIEPNYPGSRVSRLSVVDQRQYGDGDASTAGRGVFDLEYAPGSSDGLPPRVVVKVARIGRSQDHEALYRNEVDFYERLCSEIDVETPISYGAAFDEESGTFALVLEDLRLRGATFNNNQVSHEQYRARVMLDVLANLHAQFWESPRLTGDLSWLQRENSGPLYDMCVAKDHVPAYIEWVTSKWKFKQEMLQAIGEPLEDLYNKMVLVQNYRATLPQTVLHGDAHVGNTYWIGDKSGLIDWQLVVRGHFMHDVGYYIQTSLSVGDRRAWERDLIAYYLDRLRAEGVASPPTFDDAWFAYRLTGPWNVYIGWLTTDVDNYGWEICELAHLRVTTAYRDLESAKAVAEMQGL